MIGYLRSKFAQGSFSRNVLDLMSGSVVAQIITAAAAPVLTRIYFPDEFGVLALYTSIVSIGAVVLCWRYDFAIVLPEDDMEAANLLALSIILTFFMSGISAIIVLFFRESLANILDMPSITPWLLFLPASFLFMGIYQTLNSWHLRKKHFKIISASKIGQASVTVSIQSVVGFIRESGISGLIGGFISGWFVAVIVLNWKGFTNDLKFIIKSIDKRIMVKTARRFKKYPKYSTWATFINTLSLSLPVLFISRYFDADILGQYALSLRVLLIPLNLIGVSIGQVYFQRLAKEKQVSKDISRTVEKTFIKLLYFAIPGCLILLLFSQNLFEIIFGNEWSTAGVFTQILAPAMAIRFITSPLTTTFGVSNRQEIAAIWQISQLISTTSFLFGSLIFNDPIATIYALQINDVLLYTIYLKVVFKISNASFLNAFQNIFKKNTAHI
ncbi:MAG: hypothetical protein DRP35_02020 [Candidatus Zixiibacteriota bacterium]|nr:MAG: hypothetical protein DRP35_02020 [candidate division Zixibacteria bacterium]